MIQQIIKNTILNKIDIDDYLRKIKKVHKVRDEFNQFIDDSEDIKITKKNYKEKVDKELKTKFDKDIMSIQGINLLETEKAIKKTAIKKTAISVYFKEDLNLLKAISQIKNTTVNKTIMNILETTIETTKNNLPNNFDINKMVKEYDKRNRKSKK